MYVKRAFQHRGMLNAADGSEDHLIKVEGVADYDMGVSDVEDDESDGSDSGSESESDSALTDSEIESDDD